MSQDRSGTAAVIHNDPNILWCLHHRVMGLQLDGLKATEARALLTQWHQDDLVNWTCWMEGWKEWQPVTSTPNLLRPLSRKHVNPPPMLRRVGGGEAAEDFVIMNEGKEMRAEHFESGVAEYSLKDLPAVLDRDYVVREHRRIQRRLSVKIEVSGQIFRTYSVDVSVGGVLLEDALPEWVAGYCRIVLRKLEKKEEVRLNCSVVEDQQRKRLALANMSTDDERRLMVWLAA